MSSSNTAAIEYAFQHRERTLDDLMAFIRIPSVSTDPAAGPEMERAAGWCANYLRRFGCDRAEVFPTARHPVAYGEWLAAGPARPTALVYGHYDVQPAEPLDLWHSQPFEPQQRGDELFGRGASDMKGQVVLVLAAIDALLHNGGLPINLKFLIEGEEEIGSPSLGSFLKSHRELLAADFAINPDAGMLAEDVPTITYSLRGLAYFELRLAGPAHDLHSGMYGGVVHNPAQVLCELVAGMHDASGRVTLPKFYDRVRALDPDERAELARLPVQEQDYLDATGAPGLYGEQGYTLQERLGARPTLEVNGLLSGFTGQGSKTIIPARAMAKISMRLVPDQDPGEMEISLREYLETRVPPAVHWDLLNLQGGRASMTNRNLPAVHALSRALEAEWGQRPVFRREGGSIPVVAAMQEHLGIESVLTGFGLPGDNIHAPDERLHLPTFYRGVNAMIRFLEYLGNI